MENKNYTIKDIARMAGVSAGTVDRVLHSRGDVSEKSRARVQKVLDEIDYQPNRFAIGLAAKKKYTLTCIIPYYIVNDYWHAVAVGIERAAKEVQPYNVQVAYLYYLHGNKGSYGEACRQAIEAETDGILIAPNFREETYLLTSVLQEKGIPHAFIDFNIEDTGALTYIGQDSFRSGYIAAKILMHNYNDGQELVLFMSNDKESPAEIQMQRRIEGFMSYLHENRIGQQVHEVILNKEDKEDNRRTLNDFFENHSQALLGAVFNSRVYTVGEYLRETGRRMEGLIGYDLLSGNVELLRSGHLTFLIGQRPGLQGYDGIKALCEYVFFKRPVASVKFMPIDILMKENIDFYFEFE
ncbi:MAG: substrate-binding domain-containing protein [Bacteroides sp.]|nr:substrate-binding domain-containing protein [Bacteroides sp.]